jgi:hypothetical protein
VISHRLIPILVLLVMRPAAACAQTAGISVINQRNILLVVPTPNRQNPPSSNALLTRNAPMGVSSNSRRINVLNPPPHPKRRDPLQAGSSTPSVNHPLTKKFMANASASLATTAPPESSGVFPKGK